jgi:hypothetical protein
MTSKYRNVRNEVAGEKYTSLRERHRHFELILEQRVGLISNLRREVPFVLAPGAMVAGKAKRALVYRADFCFDRGGVPVVEDCKGVLTAVFIIKRHLMKTVHGIDIILS